MGDWVGTGVIAPNLRAYLPLQQAREFVCRLGLKSGNEWRKYCSGLLAEKEIKPKDIPNAPNQVYKNKGWISMRDWLGTGTIAAARRKYRPFQESREFVRGLELKSRSEWRAYLKGGLSEKGVLPKDIPANPDAVYKRDGWIGMGDWLGTGTVAPRHRQYRPFEKARQFVRSLELKGDSEWRKYFKGELPKKGLLPKDIPADPRAVYKSQGWISTGDWLGTGTVAHRFRKYRSFDEARAFVHTLGLKSLSQWKKYCRGEMPEKGKIPEDIPHSPQQEYRDQGWKTWGDWLGTGNVALYLRKYRLFEEAREFVRSLGLQSVSEWGKYRRGALPEKGTLPEDIPAAPQFAYKTRGWISWGDWLGTGTIAPQYRKFRAFDQARSFVQNLGLRNMKEWRKYSAGRLPQKGVRPEDIPADPHDVYRDQGWISWNDWLGKALSK